MFMPLEKLMEKRNSPYYKSKQTKIHEDFLTYAQNPLGELPRAIGAEIYAHHAHKSEDDPPPKILEVGVGEGAMAEGILMEIRRLDKEKGTDLSERISYALADFSPEMLKKASSRLDKSDFPVHSEFEFDASANILPPSLAGGEYDFIVCNELFSDLPSRMLVREGKKIFEVDFDEKMAPKKGQPGHLRVLEAELMAALPEGYFIPINSIAAQSASNISSLLAEGGIFHIFDYGFYGAEDFELPDEMWNLSILREYGTQITIDLNFIYLSAFLKARGLSCETEEQKAYVEKISGKKLALADSDGGLGYGESEDGFGESDSFYHLKVEKSQAD